MLSTLDWALIETWKDAGIPLEAVLRGIDATFEKYNARPSKSRKINGLAYCSQEVLAAAEDMKEAAVGASTAPTQVKGFDAAEIAGFLRRNAAELESAKLPSQPGISPEPVAKELSATLKAMAAEVEAKSSTSRLEDLERKLTVLEEKLFAVLLAAIPDDDAVAVRAQADRDLVPYRSKAPAAQVQQLQTQYPHKPLLQTYGLPRLS